RCALTIYRICPIVIIFWPTAVLKKVILEKFKAPFEILLICSVTCTFDITLEAVQVVSCMKIVYPMMIGCFTVVPSSFGQLSRATVFHRFLCHSLSLYIACEFYRSGQYRSAEHIGVMN